MLFQKDLQVSNFARNPDCWFSPSDLNKMCIDSLTDISGGVDWPQYLPNETDGSFPSMISAKSLLHPVVFSRSNALKMRYIVNHQKRGTATEDTNLVYSMIRKIGYNLRKIKLNFIPRISVKIPETVSVFGIRVRIAGCDQFSMFSCDVSPANFK